MTNGPKKQEEILPLTTLRFFAAIFVFTFHIHLAFPLAAAGTPSAQLLDRGAVGMSIFFILSGFVLAVRYAEGVGHLKDYAYSRFIRIYPVYAAAAVCTLPLLINSVEASPIIAGEINRIWQYVFIVVAGIFMVQAWIPELFKFWNNGGSWSISVEAFFYALFPALIFGFRLLGTRGLFICAALSTAFAAYIGMSTFMLVAENYFTVFYAIPIFRLPEFVVGIVCGVLYTRGARIKMPALTLFVSFMLIIAALAFGPAFAYAYIANHIVTIPLIALTIWSAASLENSVIKSALCLRPLVYLGKISYSFYSFQILMLIWLGQNRELIIDWFNGFGSNWAFWAVGFAGLTVISAISYDLLETRLRTYLLQRYRRLSDN